MSTSHSLTPVTAASTEAGASDLLAEPLMRAEEVAQLLAIKTSTIYEVTRRRRDPLPYVRIGRSKRFQPPSDSTMGTEPGQHI